MEKIVLKAEKREETGKTLVKKLRKEGFVPAVCYKSGEKSMNVKVNASELYHVLHTKAGENVLITLKMSGVKTKKERTVLVKEIQIDPLKEFVVHVDFNEISMSEKITVKIPISTHGEAKEVVKQDGIVEHIIWEVEVECLPTDIPEKIQIEIAEMKIGDAVYVKDLNIPRSVTILNDPELVVLTAKPPTKVEEKAEDVSEEEMTEPEIIAKGKKEEEEIPEGPEEAPKQKDMKKEG